MMHKATIALYWHAYQLTCLHCSSAGSVLGWYRNGHNPPPFEVLAYKQIYTSSRIFSGKTKKVSSCKKNNVHTQVVYVPNFRELDIRIDKFCIWLSRIMVGMYGEYVHTITINIWRLCMKICMVTVYIVSWGITGALHYPIWWLQVRVRSSECTVASRQALRRRVSLCACVVRVWTRAHEHFLPRALNCTPGNTIGNVGIDGIQLAKSEHTS